MPKRKSELMSHYKSKRFRPNKGRVEKIARPNQFINQLGGWTSNPGNKRARDVLRPVTTTRMVNVVSPQSSRGQITFGMASIPQSIKDVYQRVRIKKATIFCVFQPISTGNSNQIPAVIQVSISKLNQIDPDLDPRNVPGAQVKMFYMNFPSNTQLSNPSGGNDGISDAMRCSRMYPPINIDTNATVGGAPETNKYLSTNSAGVWTLFGYDFSGVPGGNHAVNMVYYLTLELLCNTMKA